MILGGGVAAGCLFTFVVASRGNVCDCIAFLLILTPGRSGAQALRRERQIALTSKLNAMG